jgi:hypothetical protein
MFTNEELAIIKMYSGFSPDRNRVITALHDSLPLIEDTEIQDTVNTVIRKANAMTEESFAALDLSSALDTEGL